MGGRLRLRGAQLVGRVPRADDPRARRNSAAQAVEFLQVGAGIEYDAQGRLTVNPHDPELDIATQDVVDALEARIAKLEAAIGAAGLVT